MMIQRKTKTTNGLTIQSVGVCKQQKYYYLLALIGLNLGTLGHGLNYLYLNERSRQ